ncbi:hypothetical protein [Aquimarina agarilytica]|uniref:hypothetical protein n=1 Tax=Aquimarina agarilytica TaxID=1087449 RepID=UPI000288F1EF|nr:hypothetical protein [Aquimarina agarilytica]
MKKQFNLLGTLILTIGLLFSCEKEDLSNIELSNKELINQSSLNESESTLNDISKLARTGPGKSDRRTSSGHVFRGFVHKKGTHIIGSYNRDMKNLISDFRYPKNKYMYSIFRLPHRQNYQVLNDSEALFNRASTINGRYIPGHFFWTVNMAWLNQAAFGIGGSPREIAVASSFRHLYQSNGKLTGFGKEVWVLEHIHGYRASRNNDRWMIPRFGNGRRSYTVTKGNDWKRTTGKWFGEDYQHHLRLEKRKLWKDRIKRNYNSATGTLY